MNEIIKQDINFLDKPLWFQDVRGDETACVWRDVDGYEYRIGYKMPDKVDFLFLLSLLCKVQEIQYEREITLTHYDIFKRCDLLGKNPQYYTERLHDSLERWLNVTLKFNGTFYDGKRYTTIGFGIIDDYRIDEETNLISIKFNENWLLKIKESEYFKYLNFEYYKALKRPLSRRLFELLCKTFKGRNEWSIGLVKLGTKLTLSGRTVGKKGQEKQVMYASDVIVAVKPAINEINRLSKTDGIREKMGLHPDDHFTLDYTITGKGQDRVINFIKILVTSATPSPSESPDQTTIKMLIGLVPPEHREKKTIQTAIIQHLRKHGQEYVKRNIEYANATHKINYRAYLDKSLKSDWGFSDQEDGLTPEIKKLMGVAAGCWESNKGNCAGFRGASTETAPACKYCPGKKAVARP